MVRTTLDDSGCVIENCWLFRTVGYFGGDDSRLTLIDGIRISRTNTTRIVRIGNGQTRKSVSKKTAEPSWISTVYMKTKVTEV